MKNCLLIIENKPTFLKAAIKHFWYKDKADFDVLVVYEPACNTSKADLEKVIIEGNNPNFLVENIYNVNEFDFSTLENFNFDSKTLAETPFILLNEVENTR
jgi:hypothetical protein